MGQISDHENCVTKNQPGLIGQLLYPGNKLWNGDDLTLQIYLPHEH